MYGIHRIALGRHQAPQPMLHKKPLIYTPHCPKTSSFPSLAVLATLILACTQLTQARNLKVSSFTPQHVQVQARAGSILNVASSFISI